MNVIKKQITMMKNTRDKYEKGSMYWRTYNEEVNFWERKKLKKEMEE